MNNEYAVQMSVETWITKHQMEGKEGQHNGLTVDNLPMSLIGWPNSHFVTSKHLKVRIEPMQGSLKRLEMID